MRHAVARGIPRRSARHQVLIPGGDPSRVDEWVADGYIQHNAEVADGLASFKPLATVENPPLMYSEIVLLVGQGNFVATLSRASWEGEPLAQADLFRLENGKVVEHWDNSEPALPDEMNSGKF